MGSWERGWYEVKAEDGKIGSPPVMGREVVACFLGHLDRWKVLSSVKMPHPGKQLVALVLSSEILDKCCIQAGAPDWGRGNHLSWESEMGRTWAWRLLMSLKSLVDQIQAVITIGWFPRSLSMLFLGELSSHSS